MPEENLASTDYGVSEMSVVVFIRNHAQRQSVASVLQQSGIRVRLASRQAELAKVLVDGKVAALVTDSTDMTAIDSSMHLVTHCDKPPVVIKLDGSINLTHLPDIIRSALL